MALILIYNDQTETIDFTVTSNNVYCSIFDEICKVIIEKFNLSNLLSDYRMVYYDPLYDLWIGFNIHVTKRITEVIRHSTSKTLKIRIEQRQRNIFTSFVKEKTIDKVESKPTEDGSKRFFFFIRIIKKKKKSFFLFRMCTFDYLVRSTYWKSFKS
jgi:hypothetical protein